MANKNPYLPEKAKILEVRQQTDIDYTFRLESNIKCGYGQFVEVSIPRVGEAPISVSDFGDGYIEMTIRRVGKLTNEIHNLVPGKHLFIRGPYGNGFPLERYKNKHLIIAAGGTGLAPVKSIINHFYRHPSEVARLDLMVGFKSPADVLFADELAKWQEKFNVTVTVDKGDENWPGNVGLITNYIKQLEIPDLENVEVIIVGPPLMMKFSALEFLNKGIRDEQIWVSFERKMCCGLGKCGHCKIDDTYICLEGPVFNYTKGCTLID